MPLPLNVSKIVKVKAIKLLLAFFYCLIIAKLCAYVLIIIRQALNKVAYTSA